MRLGVSPAAATPTGVFSQRFEALFPCWDPGLQVCLAPQLFLQVYLHMNVGLPSPPAATLLALGSPASALPAWSSSSHGRASPLPTSLDECFFFKSLVLGFHTVQFSGSSGCFLFLNLLLSFFWLCEEAECIYLLLYVGWKSQNSLFEFYRCL